MKELYAIIWKESKEILTPESFKKYWPNYGGASSYLSGWRPPKKIYFKLGQAKSGFAHVPDAAKPFLEIAKFTLDSVVEDGKVLKEKQKQSKDKKKTKKLWVNNTVIGA